jgi:hypothetical protein
MLELAQEKCVAASKVIVALIISAQDRGRKATDPVASYL